MTATPNGSLEVCREIDSGGGYRIVSHGLRVITISLWDMYGDSAVVAFDRADVRRLIDDIELVAGLRPTAPAVDRAAALAGSVRILFERLAELDRIDPAGVAQVVAAIAAHLRSSRPMALLQGGGL